MSAKGESSSAGHLLGGAANRQIWSSQEFIFDAQNMLVDHALVVEDEMNLDMDIVQEKTHVNTAYKQNRLDTPINNIVDSKVDLENMVADQVALDIIMEVLIELTDLMVPYAKVMSPLRDIHAGE